MAVAQIGFFGALTHEHVKAGTLGSLNRPGNQHAGRQRDADGKRPYRFMICSSSYLRLIGCAWVVPAGMPADGAKSIYFSTRYG